MSSRIVISQNIEELFPLLCGERVFSIIDNNLQNFPFVQQLPGEKIFIEIDEERKSLDTISSITSALLSFEADRECFILGVGGGITTDLCGFVASIYKRGVRFGFLPTTLLAQVDAAIGGKNGVNFGGYKNMLGCISEPEFVYICPELLSTLSERDMLCGIAEMLKSFILTDEGSYSEAVSFFKGWKNGAQLDMVTLQRLIRRAVEIKTNIVATDLYEHGERRLLNLGHTFGHAIEKHCTNYSHGEAVAIGIIIAAKLSVKGGLMQEKHLSTLLSDFTSLGLPTSSPLPIQTLFEAIENDKKRSGESIYFVFPTSIGSAKCKLVTIEELKSLSLKNDLL